MVVAPSLVPKKPGDRVKADRRDALELARSYRSGDLTAVWAPDEDSEALRDLVRQREAAKQDQLRARHRLTKFLFRTGRRPPLGLNAWTERYMAWLEQNPLHTAGAGSHAGGLSERSPAHERAGQAIGRGHPRSGEACSSAHAGSDPGSALCAVWRISRQSRSQLNWATSPPASRAPEADGIRCNRFKGNPARSSRTRHYPGNRIREVGSQNDESASRFAEEKRTGAQRCPVQ